MAVKVVVDTNIWLAALLNPGFPRQVVKSLEADRFILISSAELLDELERVLKRSKIAAKIAPERGAHLVALIKHHALFVSPRSPSQPISRDPKDDVFISCASAAQAEFIVTGDNDLLCLQNHERTQIVTPRQFMEFLQRIDS